MVWSVLKCGVQRGGDVAEKTMDSYTQTSIVMQISSSVKLPTVATKSALGNRSDWLPYKAASKSR